MPILHERQTFPFDPDDKQGVKSESAAQNEEEYRACGPQFLARLD
jgi:hypothetical protein